MQENANLKKVAVEPGTILKASDDIYYFLFINVLIQTRTTNFINWFTESEDVRLVGQPLVDEIKFIQDLIRAIPKNGLDNEYTKKLILVLAQINKKYDDLALETESKNNEKVITNNKIPSLLQLATWALNKKDKAVPKKEQAFANKLFADGTSFPVSLISQHQRQIPLFTKEQFAKIYESTDIRAALSMLLHWINNTSYTEGQFFPIHLAAIFKVNILPFVEQVNLLDQDKRTPLHLACIVGNLSAVSFLLSKDNVRANTKDNHVKTPLHYAAEHGHLKIVEAFFAEQVKLDKNLLLREANYQGQFPIHIAAEKNHTEIVLKFLELDPTLINVQETEFNRKTILHYAVKNGNEELIATLINKYHADVLFADNCEPIITEARLIKDKKARKQIELIFLKTDSRTQKQADYSKYTRLANNLGIGFITAMMFLAILAVVAVIMTRETISPELIVFAVLPPATIGLLALVVASVCNQRLKNVAKNNAINEKTPLLQDKVINELDEDLEKQQDEVETKELAEGLNSITANNNNDIAPTKTGTEEKEKIVPSFASEEQTAVAKAPESNSTASNQSAFFTPKVYSVANSSKNESMSIDDYKAAQQQFDSTKDKTSDFGY